MVFGPANLSLEWSKANADAYSTIEVRLKIDEPQNVGSSSFDGAAIEWLTTGNAHREHLGGLETAASLIVHFRPFAPVDTCPTTDSAAVFLLEVFWLPRGGRHGCEMNANARCCSRSAATHRRMGPRQPSSVAPR
jgi:hypothetical protein